MPVSSLLMSSLMGSGGGGGGGGGAANMASGLISGITGFFQKKKANKLLAQNQMPSYTVPNEILQNQKQAELNARTGLPSEQYNQAMQNISRQQNRTLQAATDRRGGLLAASASQQNANDATLGLDVANAKARLSNQNTAYGVNNIAAQYKDKAWDWNEKQKYLRNYGYAMNLLGTGNQNLTGGIDKFAGGLFGLTGGGGGGSKGGAASGAAAQQGNVYGTGGPTIY